MNYRVEETDKYKILKSENANYFFNKETGFMATWGKTLQDDAVKFPGPTLLDIEVTTICKGVNGKPCPFCYKANTPNGKNMPFDRYKKILDKMPPTLTQVAFGADAQLESNPDLWKMMEYTRSKGIVPNVTAAQISEATAEKLVKYCGAVAISCYEDKDACYNSVYKLTSRGMKQVNIHLMISQETYDHCWSVLDDCAIDPRLKGLNAIVFLSLKKKGRGVGHHVLSQDQFDKLIRHAMDKNLRIGFDSCSSAKVFETLKENKNFDWIKDSIIPCESTLESSYVNVDGIFYPCSFMEGVKEMGWDAGLDTLDCVSFEEDIWNSVKVEEFRNSLLTTTVSSEGCNCRCCPFFEV